MLNLNLLLKNLEHILENKNRLGQEFVEKLIISKHKHLNKGDYLIDDMASGCGQDKFEGELIQFGTDKFPDWPSVVKYLGIRVFDVM